MGPKGLSICEGALASVSWCKTSGCLAHAIQSTLELERSSTSLGSAMIFMFSVPSHALPCIAFVARSHQSGPDTVWMGPGSSFFPNEVEMERVPPPQTAMRTTNINRRIGWEVTCSGAGPTMSGIEAGHLINMGSCGQRLYQGNPGIYTCIC